MNGLYSIDIIGEPVGAGVTAPQYGKMGCVIKRNPADSPYTVANEFIASRIGLLLGLPIPPGVIVETEAHGGVHVMLRFGEADEKPPPGNPVELVRDHPDLAAGIVVFDIWVCNGDRHEKNWAYSPKLFPAVFFDHASALCGVGSTVTRLTNMAGKPPAASAIWHEIDDVSLFDAHVQAVEALPHRTIHRLFAEAVDAKAFDPNDAQVAFDGLLARRATLRGILSAASSKSMPKLKQPFVST